MRLRKSSLFIAFTAGGIVCLALLFVHGAAEKRGQAPVLNEKRMIVERLGLTDLCLFTDARYTRNPAVADRSTPFQDNPLSLDYFPSGSILPPPPHLRAHELDR
jgi:hypothetical protein